MPEYIDLPSPDEFAPVYSPYIGLIKGNAVEVLEQDMKEALALFRSLPEEKGSFRYAPDKWTVKDVINHVIDSERIYCYRALRIARGDQTELPGFDENDYAASAGATSRTFADLCNEFESVRNATLALVRSFDASVMDNRGTANKFNFTTRALTYIMAGHVRHYLKVLQERYGLGNK